ncbi:MAG: zf-HC2 domain-containing protein [Planctomycetota bacterium]
MLECEETVGPLTAAYRDGLLPPDQAAQVGAHLAGCAVCRADSELERELSLLVSDYSCDPAELARPGRWRSVLPAAAPAPATAPARRSWPRWLAAAAALLMALGLLQARPGSAERGAPAGGSLQGASSPAGELAPRVQQRQPSAASTPAIGLLSADSIEIAPVTSARRE